MQIPTAAIRQYARDVGMSEGFMIQHQELIEAFTLRVAIAQRKKDLQKLRAWYFDTNPTKTPIFEVLMEE